MPYPKTGKWLHNLQQGLRVIRDIPLLLQRRRRKRILRKRPRMKRHQQLRSLKININSSAEDRGGHDTTLQKIIRTVGRIEYDERRQQRSIRSLRMDREALCRLYGKYVRKGEALAEIYSLS